MYRALVRGRFKLLLVLMILSLAQAAAVSAVAEWAAHGPGGRSVLLSQVHALHDEAGCEAHENAVRHDDQACHDHLSGASSMPFAVLEAPVFPPAPSEAEPLPIESTGYSMSGWIPPPVPEPPRRA